MTAALNGQHNQWSIKNNILILLPTTLRKSCIYQILPFIINRDISSIGNKVPDREFYWSVDHEFYSRLGIWNCKSAWSAEKFLRKLMLLRRNESSSEQKTVSLKGFLSSKLKSSRKNVSLQDEGSDAKFSYHILTWISCKVT